MGNCIPVTSDAYAVLSAQQWPAGTRFAANISGKKVFWLGVVADNGKPYVYRAIAHRKSGLFAVNRDDRCIRIYPNGKTVTSFSKLYEFRTKRSRVANSITGKAPNGS